MIPILLSHDSTRKPIGLIHPTEDGMLLRVEFTEEVQMTMEMFFSIFGNCGMVLEDSCMIDGQVIIKKAVIVEFSLSLHSTICPDKEN